MYKYIRIDARNRSNYFAKKKYNSKPRKETRVRPTPPAAESGKAGKVRHDEQTAHGMVDLIKTYSRSFTAQNRGLKLTCRRPRRQSNISVHVFVGASPAFHQKYLSGAKKCF